MWWRSSGLRVRTAASRCATICGKPRCGAPIGEVRTVPAEEEVAETKPAIRSTTYKRPVMNVSTQTSPSSGAVLQIWVDSRSISVRKILRLVSNVYMHLHVSWPSRNFWQRLGFEVHGTDDNFTVCAPRWVWVLALVIVHHRPETPLPETTKPCRFWCELRNIDHPSSCGCSMAGKRRRNG